MDVGTGSGCLAIASAFRHPGARFVAIDISEEALAVARKNAAKHGVADRIDFRLGDRLGPVADEGPFDVVISNPPYIPTGRDPRHSRSASAITSPTWPSTAAPTASTWSRGLIEQSVPLLKPGGHLILEIGTDQEKPVRGLIEAQPGLPPGPDDPRPRPASPRHPSNARGMSHRSRDRNIVVERNMDNPEILADSTSSPEKTAVLLIAHGSRQPSANDDLHELAARLSATGSPSDRGGLFPGAGRARYPGRRRPLRRPGCDTRLDGPLFPLGGRPPAPRPDRRPGTSSAAVIPDVEFRLGSPSGRIHLLDSLVVARIRELESGGEPEARSAVTDLPTNSSVTFEGRGSGGIDPPNSPNPPAPNRH